MKHLLRGCTLALCASSAFVHAQTTGAGAPPDREEPVTLNPFVVSTEQDRGYISTNSITATRINTAVRDLPVQVGILNEAFISDIGAQTITEAMKFSAYFDAEAGNRIRGMEAMFDGNPNRNGTGVNSPGSQSSLEGMTSTDRIEVFKGPSSIINGVALPGGSLNVVTKRARWRNGGLLEGALGGLDEWRALVEYNHVVVPDTFAVLAAVSRRDQRTDIWDRRGFKDVSDIFYLAATWRYSRQGEVWVDVQYDRSTVTDVGVNAFSTVGMNGGFVPLHYLYGVPLDYGYSIGVRERENTRLLPTLHWSHEWVDGFSSLVRVSHQDRHEYDRGMNSSGPRENSATPIDPALGRRPQEIRHQYKFRDRNDGYDEVEARLLYEFEIGSLISKATVNFQRRAYFYWWDQQEDRINPTTNRYFWLPIETIANNPGAFYNLNLNTQPASVNLFNEFIDDTEVDEDQLSLRYQGELTTGVGTFHALTGLNKGWHERVGGRRAFVNGVAQPFNPGTDKRDSEWLPSGGIVYQPNDTLSIYALGNRSYTFQFRRNSFQELLPNTGGKSYEVGVKLDMLDGKVVGSVGFFDSLYFDRPYEVRNYPVFEAVLQDGTIIMNPADQARWDPITNPVVSGANSEWFAAGEFASKGVDVDLIFTPTPNWQTTFTYLYADATITNDPNPLNVGRREQNNAEHAVGTFTAYTFNDGVLRNLTVGGGYRWSSDRVEQYLTLNDQTVLYERDGANTLDLFAKYRLRLNSGNWVTFQANVFNLLQEDSVFGLVPGTQQTTRELYKFERPVQWRFTTSLEF